MAEDNSPKKEEPSANSAEDMVPRSECESKVQALQAELTAIKAIAEQSTKAADARIAAIEESYRKDKIHALVTARISDAKKAEEIYKNFVDAKLTPEVVEKTLAYIPSTQATIEDNSDKFTSKPADASTKRGSYEAYRSYVNSVVRGAL